MSETQPFDILAGPAETVAPLLLGALLVRDIGGKKLVGRIVETEAYAQTDAASHSYKGRTPRTEVMFGPPGRLYVYFTYGMHYCCNIVTSPSGHGSAVLIRAVEPLEGMDIMAANRHGRTGIVLTNGPAKFCQAFGIGKAHNRHDLRNAPIQLLLQEPLQERNIVRTTRIGISEAKEKPWRYYIRDNPYVSAAAK